MTKINKLLASCLRYYHGSELVMYSQKGFFCNVFLFTPSTNTYYKVTYMETADYYRLVNFKEIEKNEITYIV